MRAQSAIIDLRFNEAVKILQALAYSPTANVGSSSELRDHHF